MSTPDDDEFMDCVDLSSRFFAEIFRRRFVSAIEMQPLSARFETLLPFFLLQSRLEQLDDGPAEPETCGHSVRSREDPLICFLIPRQL